MFSPLPMLYCFGTALKRAITILTIVSGGIGLLLRLIGPLSARRA